MFGDGGRRRGTGGGREEELRLEDVLVVFHAVIRYEGIEVERETSTAAVFQSRLRHWILE